jgi:hypothetical protein
VSPQAKPVRLTRHAREQCGERGATEEEVVQAVQHGTREPAKRGRWLYRYNVAFGGMWAGNFYAVKQVAPVVAEEPDEIVVVTVYTFYF